jgi:hypothetical protein
MAGEKVDGHTHHFAHVTIVHTGTIHVKTSDGIDKDITAPDHFLANKDVEHEITAVTDAHFSCVYTHRDSDGEVVQEYDALRGRSPVGDEPAYQTN